MTCGLLPDRALDK